MNFFSFNFPLRDYFFGTSPAPPSPHKFSNGPSLIWSRFKEEVNEQLLKINSIDSQQWLRWEWMSIRSDPNLRQTKWDSEPQSSPTPNRGWSRAKGKTHHFLVFDAFLGGSRSKLSIYFVTSQWAPGFVQDLSGQNIVEQQTPNPPKSRMKPRKRQNAPFSHHCGSE